MKFDIKTFKPRTHQAELTTKLVQDMSLNKLIWLNTGGGKTKLAFYYMHQPSTIKQRALFVTPRISLTWETYRDIDNVGILQGSTAKDLDSRIVMCTIETLKNRITEDKQLFRDVGVVFIDEAHENGNMIQDVRKELPKAEFIYLSATPVNGQGEWLEYLKHNTYGREYDFEYLIKNNTLVPVAIKEEAQLDTTDINVTSSGEYEEKSLLKKIKESDVDICESTIKHVDTNFPTIVIATNVKHTEELYEEFKAKGYRCAVVHHKAEFNGLKGRKLTSYVLQKMRDYELDYVFTVRMFNTGVDAQTIGNIVLATRIRSWRTYIQVVGRGLRATRDNKKTHCNIIDLFGTVAELGHPFYEFTPKEKTTKKKKNKKKCIHCDSENIELIDTQLLETEKILVYKCWDCQKEFKEFQEMEMMFCNGCRGGFPTVEAIKEDKEIVFYCPACTHRNLITTIYPRELIISVADRERVLKDIDLHSFVKLDIRDYKRLNNSIERFCEYAEDKQLSFLLNALIYENYSIEGLEKVVNRVVKFVEERDSDLLLQELRGYTQDKKLISFITSSKLYKDNPHRVIAKFRGIKDSKNPLTEMKKYFTYMENRRGKAKLAPA